MATIHELTVGHIPPCEGGDFHLFVLTYTRRWFVGPKQLWLCCWECNLRMEAD
jgi:hypothetical protein